MTNKSELVSANEKEGKSERNALFLPFKEWNDRDLNEENWDTDKNKSTVFFEDSQTVHLPSSLASHDWKRPSEVFLDEHLVVFAQEEVAWLDLISSSKHLLHSEFVRDFISSVETLLYLGNTNQFQMEIGSAMFSPNTQNQPWRPWHHIYAKCKAGHNTKHSPQRNPFGKYVVRLFWMGTWRIIYVDDLLPIDKLYHVMLPSMNLLHEEVADETKLAVESGKKRNAKKIVKDVELWPFLLSKALLKLASLTWNCSNEILEFDIIQCLTGWTPQRISTKNLNNLDIWQICAGYTNHFTWPVEKAETVVSDVKSKSSKHSKKSKGSKKGKRKSKRRSDLIGSSKNITFHVMARCSDLRELAEDEIPDISPCWSHRFLIDQTRDIPLIKPPDKPELPLWKHFRWLSWAIKRGILPPDENKDPIKCFKLISPLKKIFERVVYKQPSKLAMKLKENAAIVDKLHKTIKKGKKRKSKSKSSKKSKSTSKSSKKSKSKSSSRSSKSSKKSKKKKKKKLVIFTDPSIWIDFQSLHQHLDTLYIYFKPSMFKTNIKITSMKLAAENKLEKIIPVASNLLVSRNEPIYAFVDSLDYKQIVFNLSQRGNVSILDEQIEKRLSSEKDESLKTLCLTESLFERVKRYYSPNKEAAASSSLPKLENNTTTNNVSSNSLECNIRQYSRKSHVVIEKYNWQTDKLGNTLLSFNTIGSNTSILELNPGRFCLRIWIKSDVPFVVQLLCDDGMIVGGLDDVLSAMTEESHRFMQVSFAISSAFGKLVQALGMPEFADALQNFYTSYKPNTTNSLTKSDINLIHEIFFQVFVASVSNKFAINETSQVSKSLNLLFLRFRFNGTDAPMKIFDECFNREIISNEDLIYVKLMERSAAVIQAFFKMTYVRLMMKKHNLKHKNYYAFFEELKRIYKQCFSVEQRLNTCDQMLRSFLQDPRLDEKYKLAYDFHEDLEQVLHIQQFSDAINATRGASSDDWIPICRYVFHVTSTNEILVKICLFCNLSNYLVRVFNNDTRNEIHRLTNNVSVASYKANETGYTLLCYGWSKIAEKIDWKLELCYKKESQENLLFIPDVHLRHIKIVDNYIPNSHNLICKYVISIRTSLVLTIRLSSPSSTAQIGLKLLHLESGKIIQQLYGYNNVIIPVILLNTTSELSISRSSRKSSTLVKSKSTKRLMQRSKQNELTNSDSPKKLSEKSSLKSSVTALKKTKPSITGGKLFKDVKETLYILEGYVREDTWSLTENEWVYVKQLKNNMLCGPHCLPSNNLELLFTGDDSKNESARRRSSKSRGNGMEKGPLFSLHILCEAGDGIEVKKDRTREEEIKAMKRMWYENNPGRYKQSEELRLDYLKSNLNLPENELNEIDTFLIKNNATDFLPPYDLSLYYHSNLDGEDADGENLKNDESLKNDEVLKGIELEQFEEHYRNCVDNMKHYLQNQTDRFELINQWYDERRADSAEIMMDAFLLREKYIKKALEETSNESGKKKGDKKKGGKKHTKKLK